tara:strand:- start:1746 stop:2315 length:570 start_codon:yes stop_codon:yes gene_type:complete
MSWKDILKVDYNLYDIRRLGNKYALMDMYNSQLLSQEKYDKLPNHGGRKRKGLHNSKESYHLSLHGFLRKHMDSPFYNKVSKYTTFHNTMHRRLERIRKNPDKMKLKTYPTLELAEQSKARGEEGSVYQNPAPQQKRTKTELEYRKMLNMLQNLFNSKGLKTKEEVESRIGRELKDSEIKAYEEAKKTI